MLVKTILLTGGSGFIGKNILESFSIKYKVHSPTHRELDLLKEESVLAFFKSHGFFDVVIHTANIGGTRRLKDDIRVCETNFKMFLNVALQEKYYTKFINLGSGAVYDKRWPIIKVKESDFGRSLPVDPYGLSKYLSSETIGFLKKSVDLRLFGVFGKYEDYQLRFISNSISKSIFNLPITIRQNAFFDYLYIDDFLKILDFFITSNNCEQFYNVGSGTRIDLVSIAKIINRVALKKAKIVVYKKGLGNEYTCDNSLLLKEIKNLKLTKIEVAIKQLYGWFLNNRGLIDEKAIAQDVYNKI